MACRFTTRTARCICAGLPGQAKGVNSTLVLQTEKHFIIQAVVISQEERQYMRNPNKFTGNELSCWCWAYIQAQPAGNHEDAAKYCRARCSTAVTTSSRSTPLEACCCIWLQAPVGIHAHCVCIVAEAHAACTEHYELICAHVHSHTTDHTGTNSCTSVCLKLFRTLKMYLCR